MRNRNGHHSAILFVFFFHWKNWSRDTHWRLCCLKGSTTATPLQSVVTSMLLVCATDLASFCSSPVIFLQFLCNWQYPPSVTTWNCSMTTLLQFLSSHWGICQFATSTWSHAMPDICNLQKLMSLAFTSRQKYKQNTGNHILRISIQKKIFQWNCYSSSILPHTKICTFLNTKDLSPNPSNQLCLPNISHVFSSQIPLFLDMIGCAIKIHIPTFTYPLLLWN